MGREGTRGNREGKIREGRGGERREGRGGKEKRREEGRRGEVLAWACSSQPSQLHPGVSFTR